MTYRNYETVTIDYDQRHRISVRQSYCLPTNQHLSQYQLDPEQTISDQQNLKKEYQRPEHEYQLKIRETGRLPFGVNRQRPASISRSHKKMASSNLRSLSSKRQQVRRILSPKASRKTSQVTLKATTQEKKYLDYSRQIIKEKLKRKFIQIQKKHTQIQQVSLKCKTLPALYQNIMGNFNIQEANIKQSTFRCLDSDKAKRQLETSDGQFSFSNS